LSEAEYKRVLASLYSMSKMRFALKAGAALRTFAQANNQQFPTDVTQLKPYFAEPIDDAMLQRYAVQPKSNYGDVRVPGDWVLAEITSPDELTDRRYLIGAGGSDTVLFRQDPWADATKQRQERIRVLMQIVQPALTAYAKAHDGAQPKNPDELFAYTTTPEQRTALQKLMELPR